MSSWLKNDTITSGDPEPGAAPADVSGGTSTGSLLVGEESGSSGSDAAGAAGAGDQEPVIPEKFLVKGDDGSLNLKATLDKMSGSYAALEKRLGAPPPATVAEYQLEAFMPEGYELGEDKQAKVLEEFHALGMTNTQANGVLKLLGSNFAATLDNDSKLSATSTATLKEVWGDAFDTNLKAARLAVTHYLNPEQREALKDPRLGSNPVLLQHFATLGRELSGDQLPGQWDEGNTMDIEKMRSSPAYLDAKHPDHNRTAKIVADAYASGYVSRLHS